MRLSIVFILFGLVASLIGCTAERGARDPDAGSPDAASADAAGTCDPCVDACGVCEATAAVFDPAHLLDVQISMDPDDFDELRNQRKGSGSSCEPGVAVNLYTYFPADVTIDGVTVEDVGVRNKGGGSRSVEKPSMKIKFSEYVSGQRYKGMKRMTFNNTFKTDPSFVKQCLGYQLFAAAGIPAPRCNFGRLHINGEDFGIYVHVESVKKRFLARHFANNAGNLYEATGSDFRPEWVDRFERKTNKSDPDRSDLDAVMRALQADDNSLLDALAPVIDVDRVITFWAMELLIHHTDSFSGLANNFFVYNDPGTGQFQLIPWGIDNTFKQTGGRNFCKTTLIPLRLSQLPATWSTFESRVAELLGSVWKVDELLAEVDRMETLIGPVVDPTGTNGFAGKIQAVRRFIADRPAILAGGPAPWTAVLLPFCWDTGCGPN